MVGLLAGVSSVLSSGGGGGLGSALGGAAGGAGAAPAETSSAETTVTQTFSSGAFGAQDNTVLYIVAGLAGLYLLLAMTKRGAR